MGGYGKVSQSEHRTGSGLRRLWPGSPAHVSWFEPGRSKPVNLLGQVDKVSAIGVPHADTWDRAQQNDSRNEAQYRPTDFHWTSGNGNTTLTVVFSTKKTKQRSILKTRVCFWHFMQ